jgi:methionine synthase II (cobalamin-independent)
MRQHWVDTSQCGRQPAGNALLWGLCACCLVLVLFSAVMGSSPTARDRVAVQCSSLLERWGPAKRATKKHATAKAPASVQLAESKFGSYAKDLHQDVVEAEHMVQDEIKQALDKKAFDVDRMLPTAENAGTAHHMHQQAGKSGSQLRKDIHGSVNVHRDICNTQDGSRRLFSGENLLHNSRPYYEAARKRLAQLRQSNNSSDCPFAEFHTSSHSYDTPICK